MDWHIKSHLPPQEPNLNNMSAYLLPQLISGTSQDGRYVFDAVYCITQQSFVLTLMEVNNELGFIERETHLYPNSRVQLLQHIHHFQHNPEAYWVETAPCQSL